MHTALRLCDVTVYVFSCNVFFNCKLPVIYAFSIETSFVFVV